MTYFEARCKMTKPTVYLDTNIISSFWYVGNDATGRSRRGKTREWWEDEHQHFSVWASAATEVELAAGRFRRQVDCLRFVRRLPYLTITGATRRLASQLVERGVGPGRETR